MSNRIYSDEELTSLMREGQMIAFDQLYNRYGPRVYSFVYKLIKSKSESEDLVQEIFVKLWQKRKSLDEKKSIKSYLFTIAYNSSISVLRKNATNPEFISIVKMIQDPEDKSSNSLAIEYDELKNKLEASVSELPDRQKEVYQLSREEGLSNKQIAEKMSISLNTVENHMSKALKYLRSKIDSNNLLTALFISLFI